MSNRAENKPWLIEAAGLTLSVRLTPRSSRDGIDGVEMLGDGRAVLKVRVRATPNEGEANTALLSLLAKSLSLAKRDVHLTAGATARQKRISIVGNSADLAARLEKLACQGLKQSP